MLCCFAQRCFAGRGEEKKKKGRGVVEGCGRGYSRVSAVWTADGVKVLRYSTRTLEKGTRQDGARIVETKERKSRARDKLHARVEGCGKSGNLPCNYWRDRTGGTRGLAALGLAEVEDVRTSGSPSVSVPVRYLHCTLGS